MSHMCILFSPKGAFLPLPFALLIFLQVVVSRDIKRKAIYTQLFVIAGNTAHASYHRVLCLSSEQTRIAIPRGSQESFKKIA